jgi:hypothetical protein
MCIYRYLNNQPFYSPQMLNVEGRVAQSHPQIGARTARPREPSPVRKLSEIYQRKLGNTPLRCGPNLALTLTPGLARQVLRWCPCGPSN